MAGHTNPVKHNTSLIYTTNKIHIYYNTQTKTRTTTVVKSSVKIHTSHINLTPPFFGVNLFRNRAIFPQTSSITQFLFLYRVI